MPSTLDSASTSAESNVDGILNEASVVPAPERDKQRTWKQFIHTHWDTPYACDSLIKPAAANDNTASGEVRCRSRLGGLLNFYYREAA